MNTGLKTRGGFTCPGSNPRSFGLFSLNKGCAWLPNVIDYTTSLYNAQRDRTNWWRFNMAAPIIAYPLAECIFWIHQYVFKKPHYGTPLGHIVFFGSDNRSLICMVSRKLGAAALGRFRNKIFAHRTPTYTRFIMPLVGLADWYRLITNIIRNGFQTY